MFTCDNDVFLQEALKIIVAIIRKRKGRIVVAVEIMNLRLVS